MFLTQRVVRMSAMSEARVKAKEEIDTYRAELEASFQQKKEMVRDGCWLVMV